MSRIGLEFARWKLNDKLQQLGLGESGALAVLLLLMIPFPRLDVLLTPAAWIYGVSLLIAVVVGWIEEM